MCPECYIDYFWRAHLAHVWCFGFFLVGLLSLFCFFVCFFGFLFFSLVNFFFFRVTFTKHKDLSLEVYSWFPENKNIQVALVPKSSINFSSHVTGLVCATSFQWLFMSFYLSISHTKFITNY